MRIVTDLPDDLTPVTAEPVPVVQASPTPSDADLLGPPDLPDITLSPTPLSRSPLTAVYLGWDRVHRCDVIVKVQRVTNDPVAMDRFRREAAVMARLRHPSIVSLYRFYEGDPAALVMEYVRGQTLAALVTADGWLPSPRVAAIVDSIAAALDSAHAESIIHRDVKPANILLPRRGPARLTDFGVAHIDEDAPLTLMGDMLGTIEYASPEQVRGHETPDARSDVYSLAAVTYFALTGTPPFRAADSSTQAQLSVMHRQVFADPPPLRFHRESISPEVEAVVLRGLAKAPEDRFQTAGYFAAAFHAAAKAETGTPQQNALAAASRRNGALAGSLAAAAVLLLGGGVWWHRHHAEGPPQLVRVASQPIPAHSALPHAIAAPLPKSNFHLPAKQRVVRQPTVRKQRAAVLKAPVKPRRAAPVKPIVPPPAAMRKTLKASLQKVRRARPITANSRLASAASGTRPIASNLRTIKPASFPVHPVHLVRPAFRMAPLHPASSRRPVPLRAKPIFVPPVSEAADEPPPPHLRNP